MGITWSNRIGELYVVIFCCFFLFCLYDSTLYVESSPIPSFSLYIISFVYYIFNIPKNLPSSWHLFLFQVIQFPDPLTLKYHATVFSGVTLPLSFRLWTVLSYSICTRMRDPLPHKDPWRFYGHMDVFSKESRRGEFVLTRDFYTVRVGTHRGELE